MPSRLLLFTTVVLFAALGLSSPQKQLTPEQKRFQSESAQWSERIKTLHQQGRAAFAAEMAREKAGDCPDANSTRAQEVCLQSELEKTQANYAIFAGAIRAVLALPTPTMPGQQQYSGPTGTPLSSEEQVAQFDRLEAESKNYRKEAASAAFNQYKGGTLAPVFEGQAELRLLRLHMQELAFIFGWH